MISRRAACSCGQLSVECAGEPTKISLCHCLVCQRRTGSTYGIAAFFRREDVAVRGAAREYKNPADGGDAVNYRFCPNCGSTVLWEPPGKPGTVAVAVGSFADPSFPAPTQSVNDAFRHAWVEDPG